MLLLALSFSLSFFLLIHGHGGKDESGDTFMSAPLNCNLATLKDKNQKISICLSPHSHSPYGNKQVPESILFSVFQDIEFFKTPLAKEKTAIKFYPCVAFKGTPLMGLALQNK